MKANNWVMIVLVVFAVIFVLGAILSLSGVINITNTEAGEKMRNRANLITVDDLEDLDGTHSGVDVTVNKDGSLTLDGTASADITLTLLNDADGFGKRALLALGGVDFGKSAEGTYIGVYNGSEFEARSYAGETVFISTGTTEHNVKLVIPKGARFDSFTLYPMLNYGVTAESFYKVVQ